MGIIYDRLDLDKLDDDAAKAMVRMMSDHKIYQNMMGRDVNFRYSDLSSVFQNPKPLRYIRRIFSEGDMEVPSLDRAAFVSSEYGGQLP